MEIVSIIAKTNTGELFDLPISELSSGGNSNIKKGVIPKGGDKGLVESNIQELENGQVQLTKYTTDKSYIGNPVALLAYDGSGKIVSYPLSSGNASQQATQQIQEVSFNFKGTPQTISLFSDDGLEDSDIRRFPTGNYSLGGDNPFFKFELYRGSFNIVQLNSSDGFRMNGRLVLSVDIATNKITIGNATYNVVQMHTATLTGGILNIVKEGNASNSINWTNLAGTVTDYLKPSALGFELKSSLNAYTLSADMLNMTGDSIIATNRTAWMLGGNAATAQTVFGTTSGNFDIQVLRNNTQVGMWRSGGLTVPNLIGSELTASELVATDSNKKLVSLAVATYPSLTELSYVKGATSNLQAQITGKFTTPTGLTTNYVPKWNGTTFVNTAMTVFSDGNTMIGSTTYYGETRLGVFGGIGGANVDVRGNSGMFVDQATIELEGANYDTEVRSVYLQYRGSTFTGTTAGFSNNNLARLVMNGEMNLIWSNLDKPIAFGTNDVERMRLNSSGLHLTTLSNATTDTDKFLVSDSGVIKYRTGAEILSDIGGVTLPTLTANYLPKSNGTTLVNSSIFDDGSNLVTTSSNLYLSSAFPIIHLNGSQVGALVIQLRNHIGGVSNAGFEIYDNTAGASRLAINSSGNVGIGTTSPNSRLEISGGGTSTTGGAIRLTNTVGSYTMALINGIPTIANSGISIYDVTADINRFVINSSGFVGINTTEPGSYLEIAGFGASASGGALRLRNTADSYVFALVNGIPAVTNSGFSIYDANTSLARLTVNVSGFVGLGNLTATRQLHIYGSGQAIGSGITDAGNKGGTIYLQDSGSGAFNGGAIIFGALQGNFAGIKSTIRDGGGNTRGDLDFQTRNSTSDTSLTSRLFIQSTGEIGIGTLSPSYKLDVTGTGHFTGAVTFDSVPSSLVDAMTSNHLVRYSQWIASATIKYLPTAVKSVALTNITLSGTQTVSGVALVATDRCLVMGQSTASQNGPYVVAAGAWTRATDSDSDSEIRGYIISVSGGTYAGYKYINTNTSAITVDTTSITYSEFSNTAETDPIFVSWRDTSKTANTFFAGLNGSSGAATFRAIVAADIPTLNQNTTGSAATLTTARDIAITGDATYTVSFNGSGNITGALTLATVATVGTYRSVTVNAKGLVTSGTNPTTVSGYGITDITSVVLTGYTSGAGTVAATDTILQAIQKLNGNIGAFSGTYVNLTSNVTGILPIANGGTGSSTKNFVDLTTNQTVAGVKTFSSDGVFNGVNIGSKSLGATILGASAGNALVSGANNTFIGSYSGTATTTGGANTFVGVNTGSENTDGFRNTFLGSNSGKFTTTGYDNVFVGSDAGIVNTTGFGNFFGGYNSGYANTTGGNNVAIGKDSLGSNTTASGNVAIGKEALLYSYSGGFNVAIGNEALSETTTGTNNIGIGAYVQNLAATNINSITIGYAVVGNGNNTVTIGNSSITANFFNGTLKYGTLLKPNNVAGTNGQFLKTNGTQDSWANISASDISGLSGVYLTTVSLTTNVTGILPIANGGTGSATQNFVDLTTTQTSIGGTKTFTVDMVVNGVTIGRGGGFISTNTAIGNGALTSNSTGARNTGLGSGSFPSGTTGSDNTAIGANAMVLATTCSTNTALGALL